MASQIFRSGTSIGANIREAQNAESKADFIHKFKIAAKEADEVNYWLLLCRGSEFYPNPDEKLFNELNSNNFDNYENHIFQQSEVIFKSSNFQIIKYVK